MRISGSGGGRLLLAALGALLFLFIALPAFVYTLPKETLLAPVRQALGRQGIELSCEDAHIGFPLRLVCTNPRIVSLTGGALALDSATASFEWTGLLRWLPFHLRAARGAASVDVRTSPLVSNPGKVRIRLAKVGSQDLEGILPGAAGTGFLIDAAEFQVKRSSSGSISGKGEGALSWLRFPVPAKGSPVQEVLLHDVRVNFVVRGGTIHVSSLRGTYEGSDIDGTGEVARFLTPSRSAITFHLRIVNPLEGKIATLFDLVSKNAKNANLRISGTLLSPTGEFQFF